MIWQISCIRFQLIDVINNEPIDERSIVVASDRSDYWIVIDLLTNILKDYKALMRFFSLNYPIFLDLHLPELAEQYRLSEKG